MKILYVVFDSLINVVYVYMYTCIHVYMYTCIHVYVYVYVYVCTISLFTFEFVVNAADNKQRDPSMNMIKITIDV